jgi:ATP-binding cassette, subfamily C, bacterial CydC
MRPIADIVARSWRADRSRFVAGIVAGALTVLAGVALLGVAGWFIAASALAGVAGIGFSFNFFQPSAAIRLLAIARTGSRYAERLVTHDAALRFLSVLRVDLFRGLASLKASTLARWRGAEMLQRLTSDIDALDNLYLRLVSPAAVLAIVAGVLMFALLQISSSAAAVVASLLLGGLATAIGVGALTRRDARRHSAAQEALRVRSVDLVRAQIDLAVAGRLAAQKQSALDAARRMTVAARRLDAADLASGAILSLLGCAALLSVFLVAAGEVRAGRMEGPVLVLVLLVTLAAVEAVAPLRRGALDFGRTLFAARRIAPLLVMIDAGGRAVGEPDKTRPPLEAPALQLDDVLFRYAPGRAPVLAGLKLTVEPGERVALVGASGSGKSTLLAMVAGLVEPTSGCIRMAGRPLSDIPAAERLACIAMLTQRTELFRDSITANLRVAAPNATESEMWDALAAVGLDAKVRGLAGGLQARLGEGGAGVAGGEARRLALARVILKAPPVWLLDEPTAGLDEALAVRVMANLARRAGSATIIIAAHHAREAACADRVVRLDAPKQAPALQLAPSDAHFRVESKILLRHDGDASA